MESEALLLGLSEVSIAITGFTGVVGAVSAKSWGEVERFRFINLTALAIGATLCSFLPLALLTYNISEALSWVISAALLSLFVIVFQINGLFRVRKLNRIPGLTSNWTRWFLVIGSTIVVALQLVGIMLPSIIGATYITGILVMILQAVVQFVVFVIRIFVENDK
jgi:hypothetical protein